MAEIQTSNSIKKNTGVKKLCKKSTKVDLTPMVDLGFLLITFFVFTSTMARATAMQMYETKAGEPMPVEASGATTILLGKDNSIFYYFGDFETAKLNNKIVKTDFVEIRKMIVTKKKTTAEEKLMFIIKETDEATFGNAMKIIDEMIICGIKAGHYAEDKMGIEEQKMIN